ncbi:MAG: 16S rRNA (guanine(527)-N(7))-methyltransferase RsmG [Ignavibacteria bacterium]|nr:16S rRNA (guanine(527)-N(7))-methyltransferase RsmG [Ignavibacteria bacterium]
MEKLKLFLAKELKIEDSDVYKQFLEYNKHLMEWNSKINLVSRKLESIENNIINSIFFITKYKLENKFSLVDIGTGGGFPAIPLKILYPDARILCVDSIAKKIMVVKDIIDKMGLRKINALAGRAEDIAKKDQFRHQYDYVTAKAVAPIKEVKSFGEHFLKSNGKYILIKGGDISEEVNAMRDKPKIILYEGMEEYGVEDKKLVVIKA